MEDYNLVVGFKAFSSATVIPNETLIPLAETAKKMILDHFAAAHADPKAAFEAHKRCPYPGDAVQEVLRDVDYMMHKCLDRDYGPTAVDSLHPIVSFEKT